jgi:4-carboxymuconolactone decarboxylase
VPDETPAEWERLAREVHARLRGGGDRAELGIGDNPMAELAPDLAKILGGLAIGRQYSRPQLDLKTRALCTSAALIALGEEPYAVNWLSHALNVGATREELVELASQLFFYVGSPRAVQGFAAVREALRRHDL